MSLCGSGLASSRHRVPRVSIPAEAMQSRTHVHDPTSEVTTCLSSRARMSALVRGEGTLSPPPEGEAARFQRMVWGGRQTSLQPRLGNAIWHPISHANPVLTAERPPVRPPLP